jgi:cytochrome c553
LRNKWGKLYKTLNILSSTSPATLSIVIDIPQGVTNTSSPMADRLWGQQLASMDHQAVFKKDCVHCHLEPAFGKYGQNLYTAACGICHEAKQRATMVPDLHALNTPVDSDYWHHWVTYGKPGTLMPGFAATLGGPLEDDQIRSLVDYLKTTFPRPLKSDTASSPPAR